MRVTHATHAAHTAHPCVYKGVGRAASKIDNRTHHTKIHEESRVERALVCTPETLREFNATLRAELPEAHALAKELVALGLMEGLRGARIGPVGGFEAGAVPILSDATEKRLRDAEWARQSAAKGRAGR